MANNSENANAKKIKPMILEKGKDDNFTVQFNEVPGTGDLQKTPIKIKWNDSFRESKLIKTEAPKVTVEQDTERK